MYKLYICSALPGWKYKPLTMCQLKSLPLHLDWSHLSLLYFRRHIGVCHLYVHAMVAYLKDKYYLHHCLVFYLFTLP